jgi:hypothetical protein
MPLPFAATAGRWGEAVNREPGPGDPGCGWGAGGRDVEEREWPGARRRERRHGPRTRDPVGGMVRVAGGQWRGTWMSANGLCERGHAGGMSEGPLCLAMCQERSHEIISDIDDLARCTVFVAGMWCAWTDGRRPSEFSPTQVCMEGFLPGIGHGSRRH